MILWLSKILLPFVISYVIAFGLISRRPIFNDFLDGAKDGMKTVADILPTLIGLIAAVGVVRASGLLDAVTGVCARTAGTGTHYPGASGFQLGSHRAFAGSVSTVRTGQPHWHGSIGPDEQHRDGLLLSQYLFWQCAGAPHPLYCARSTDRYGGRDRSQYLDYWEVMTENHKSLKFVTKITNLSQSRKKNSVVESGQIMYNQERSDRLRVQ